MADIYERLTKNKNLELALRVIAVLILLYFFLVGVKTLSTGLNLAGGDFAKTLFDLTSNPFISLMAGILATVLFQSSSVTTSIIVGLVASGTLTITGAVPMIMGANVGTSVTNSLVSLGYVRDTQSFKKAFAAATVHDFFNLITVAILLPLEISFGFIEKMATSMASFLYGSSASLSFSSPIKAAIKPAVTWFKVLAMDVIGKESLSISLVVIAAVIILVSLGFIVKTMARLIELNEGKIVEKFLSKNAYLAVLFGIAVTVAAQSSSITTSLLVPLAGSGFLSLRSVFPVTIGANIGTTATALLAALTGNMAGLSIALVHFLFNIIGAAIFLPIPFMRNIPVRMAEGLAESIEKTKLIGFGYVGTVFFIIPLTAIFVFG